MMTADLIDAVRHQFALDWHGIHGIRHWSRVYANGMRLAAVTGARIRVVQLFALFHDSCRQDEGSDPDHGPRGARLARSLYGSLFHLGDEEFALLEEACRQHTVSLRHDDITVATCFDADRLDLGRVGTRPDPKLLSTDAARNAQIISWAQQRSITDHLPGNILADHL